MLMFEKKIIVLIFSYNFSWNDLKKDLTEKNVNHKKNNGLWIFYSPLTIYCVNKKYVP